MLNQLQRFYNTDFHCR